MCVCVCVCVSVYIYLYIYTHSHTHTHTYIYIYVCVCECVYIYIYIYWLNEYVDCSPMVQETGVRSQVESYRRLKKWYLILPCLALRNIRLRSRVKWSNPGKEVAPSSTLLCSSYLEGSLWVTLD